MGRAFQSRPLGDILISSGRKVRGPNQFPWKDYYQFLREYWIRKGKEMEPGLNAEKFWQKTLEQGGTWKESKNQNLLVPQGLFLFPSPKSKKP